MTGRIGAGKETLIRFLVYKGFAYLESSKLLNEELQRRGLEITRKNQQDLGDEWRKKYGHGALMKKFLDKIDITKNYIIDSLRNKGEIDFLRKYLKDVVIIAVDAPQEIRFRRIQERGKSSDPQTWEEFVKVDSRDYFDIENPNGQQVKLCMEQADFIYMNNENFENINKETEKIWNEIKDKMY